jgi:hypothetical protein
MSAAAPLPSQRIVAEAPRFAGYLEETDREIPVVRLTRTAWTRAAATATRP